MGERPDQIERQIAETRSELNDNFGELHDKVKSAMDWRVQFQEHPGTCLAVAFGSGVMLSALLPSNHTRAMDRGAQPLRESAGPKPGDLRHTVEAFTAALLGVAVKQASGFFDSLLPGFHQEFTKAKDKALDSDLTSKSDSSPRPLVAGVGA
jgi:hypothetical protein